MKKFILFAAAAVFTITMIGCKGGGGDPKEVLSNFFDALSKKDVNEAKKYATKDSESMMQIIDMGFKAAGDTKGEDEYNKNDLEFGEAKIEGDKATVPVKHKKKGETTNYILKKEGGNWKVAFDKATMTEMSGDKLKDMNKGMEENNNMDNTTPQIDTTQSNDMRSTDDTTRQ